VAVKESKEKTLIDCEAGAPVASSLQVQQMLLEGSRRSSGEGRRLERKGTTDGVDWR